MSYSKLLGWEIWNFMGIKHAKLEFDETGIINLKGYNDSGKSSAIRALRVLFFNQYATKQTDFIRDDETYFRVVAYFDDGVSILRDKYINGQSLYEMYKDNAVVYSTKVKGVPTRVTDVPEPIANYLGLITWGKIAINARDCKEPLLAVDTKGSENYQMFNTVLKSEEIAMASSVLNNDKNKLASDIAAVDNELQLTKQMCGVGKNLTLGVIDDLKVSDAQLDETTTREGNLSSAYQLISGVSAITITPELELVDTNQLETISNISGVLNELNSIHELPAIEPADTSQLDMLSEILAKLGSANSIKLSPELGDVNLAQLGELQSILGVFNAVSALETELSDLTAKIQAKDNEIQSLNSELTKTGVKAIKCPNCGKTILAEEGDLRYLAHC